MYKSYVRTTSNAEMHKRSSHFCTICTYVVHCPITPQGLKFQNIVRRRVLIHIRSLARPLDEGSMRVGRIL
jgi:hypothetical protein